MQSSRVQVWHLAGNAASMIGLCQERKPSRRAAEERACKILSDSSPRVLASQPWFVLDRRTRLPLTIADQRVVLPRRLSWCFPASLETYQREHPELALFRPVGLTARPGRPRTEEILLVRCHVLRSDGTRLHHVKIPVAAIDGHQIS